MPRLSPRDCHLYFFDCESGGLSPGQHDMVEVAVVLTDSTGKTVIEEYSTRVFPTRPVDPKAAEINGYSVEKWAESAVPITEAMRKLVHMSRDAMFTAHNAAFDWGFFETAMRPLAMRWSGDYHKVDTVAMAIPLLKLGFIPNVRLPTLAEYFKIDTGEPHRALSDARTCRQVYLRIMEMWERLGLQAPTNEAVA